MDEKLEKVIKILKKHISVIKLFMGSMEEPVYSIDLNNLPDNEHYVRYNNLTKEEFETLNEFFNENR